MIALDFDGASALSRVPPVDAQGRGVGVRALAEAMAQTARGDAREYEAYKGAASEVAKRLRRDLRLPGGERLGADISRTAAP